MKDKLNSRDNVGASVLRGSSLLDDLKASGVYSVKCIGRDGKVKWVDAIKNVVTTEGKNAALDAYLAGSSYTVTGPYMGLISSAGWSSVSAGDTMSSHAGWHEAGHGSDYPLYSGTRKTCVWSSASSGSKSLSSALSFVIETTGGTVKGCFITFGSGASSTIGSTGGVLYSAGTFIGGDKVVDVGDTLQVSYTASL